MLQIVLATNNPGKVREFQELSKSAPWLKLVAAPEGFDVEETGSTFLENATLKATAAAALTGNLAIADDSGLAVEALGGRPGLHSARYCEGSDADRRDKLLKEMVNVPEGQRQAAFVCAMALVDGHGKELHQVLESWTGTISFSEAGSNGFGYDPIFIVEEDGMTSAELSCERKNEISHRAQAWSKMLEYLKQMCEVGATEN
jgi:XTP/dITP diphosphohydrolase